MYVPKPYGNTDLNEINRFIRDNGFALLVSNHENIPFASHIPLMLEEKDEDKKILRGHLARGNPQWRDMNGQQALAIFQGAHYYVSSSWYNHVNVPTWNYIAVHVYGKIKIIDGDELYQSLVTLVNKYEASMQKPVTVEGMKDYAMQQMKGIVGFEMTLDKIEGKWKMSQNRDDDDYVNIIKELEKLNDANAASVADEMKKLRKS